MSSPAKKRKLNSNTRDAAIPSRGLEYFFSKQRQNGPASNISEQLKPSHTEVAAQSAQTLSDEDLARRLQEEWNRADTSQEASREETSSHKIEISTHSERMLAVTQSLSAVDGVQDAVVSPGLASTSKNTLSLQSIAMTDDITSASLPLDESPLNFEPSKYVQKLREGWASENGNASYAFLTRCFVLVSATQSRIKIVDTLVNCLRVLIESDPDSLLPAVRRIVWNNLPVQN
jgi:DNA ligase 1